MAPPSTRPTLHYLDIGSLGRGEVVRQVTTFPPPEVALFFKDAGIEFQDIRYPYDDTWPATKESFKTRGLSATGLVPVLEYDGAILTQHISILRFLARELGGYDGETSLEKHTVDTVSDVYNDWRTQWVANLGKVSDDFRNKTVPAYYDVLSGYYSKTNGPFLLGDRISYADFAVYQSIDNDEKIGTLPATLPPAIATFRKSFEARPNVAAYLASGRNTKI